jgi:hypothetical protein
MIAPHPARDRGIYSRPAGGRRRRGETADARSAKADIAFSQPRIHSPGCVGLLVAGGDAGKRRTRGPRRRTSRFPSREFIRRGVSDCRWPAETRGNGGRAVRAGGHRVFPAANSFAGVCRTAGGRRRRGETADARSAQADIAFSQPRIHSPGVSACWWPAETVWGRGNVSAKADITFSQPRIHSPGVSARWWSAETVWGRGNVSAQADIASSQPRIHSPGLPADGRCPVEARTGVMHDGR